MATMRNGASFGNGGNGLRSAEWFERQELDGFLHRAWLKSTGVSDETFYGHWYAQNTYKKIEPPADHPIRQIWKLWEQTQAEPDEAKRNATFQQLLGVHKEHPYAIGVVGEKVSPIIVATNYRNFLDGFIADDTLRDDGLLNPAQYFIKK